MFIPFVRFFSVVFSAKHVFKIFFSMMCADLDRELRGAAASSGVDPGAGGAPRSVSQRRRRRRGHITPAGGRRRKASHAGRERASEVGGGEGPSSKGGNAARLGLGPRAPAGASYRRLWLESRRPGRCCRHRCSRE